jgi:hypothetical protein
MPRLVRVVAAAALVLLSAGLGAQTPGAPSGVVVHEWGTFTSVAAPDGGSVEWLPLGGPQDLPCFVYHYTNPRFKFIGDDANMPLDYQAAKTALRGTFRMETPVIYFYSPRETAVDAQVWFPQGLLTEWYPRATVTQAPAYAASLRDPKQSTILWSGVSVRPGTTPELPKESAASHYYAARETGASPLSTGGQDERFLFYRGVGGAQVPLAAVVSREGQVTVTNKRTESVPTVLLFENRGGKIGYRVARAVQTEATLAPVALTANAASLHRDLEAALVSAGLYEREAKAMVATWQDSWFEEGTRLLYILPQAAVDSMLPLKVTPAPSQVARVFVGRMELLTSTTLRAASDAIAEADTAAIEMYGRFLGPIGDRLMAGASNDDRKKIETIVNAAYRAFIDRVGATCK